MNIKDKWRSVAGLLVCALILNLFCFSSNQVLANDVASMYDDMGKVEFDQEFYNEGEEHVKIHCRQNATGNEVWVFVNDCLTQYVTSNIDNNLVTIQYFQGEVKEYDNVKHSDTVLTKQYKISSFAKDICYDNFFSENSGAQMNSLSMDGWTLYGTFSPITFMPDTKICKLYYRNYDEEPDLHRYSGKQIKFSMGTAVGIIVSVLATFLAGSVTVNGIVIALGSAIVSDVITKSIEGEVCFSTQKISYAPIISDKFVWNDAYITKRWVIVDDKVHVGRYTALLDRECYESNRGTTPEEIARNAQIATRTGEG